MWLITVDKEDKSKEHEKVVGSRALPPKKERSEQQRNPKTEDKTPRDIHEEMDAKKGSQCQCGSLHSDADTIRQDRQSVDELKIGR